MTVSPHPTVEPITMSRTRSIIPDRTRRAACIGALAVAAAGAAARGDVIVVTPGMSPLATDSDRSALIYLGARADGPAGPDLTLSDHTVNERGVPDPPGDPDPMTGGDGDRGATERSRTGAFDGFAGPAGDLLAPGASAPGSLPTAPTPGPGAFDDTGDIAGGAGDGPFAPGSIPAVPAPGVLGALGLLALAAHRRRRQRAAATHDEPGHRPPAPPA